MATDLGQLLGTLLASLAHARRIADEETAMIAEYYKDHPLLEGMSLPRIRVPEMTLDVPMLILSHESGSSNEPADTGTIVTGLAEELQGAAKREALDIDNQSIDLFAKELNREVERLRPQTPNHHFSREVVVRASERAFSSLIKRQQTERTSPHIPPDAQKRITADLRHRASQLALKKSGAPPLIEASITTAEVKEGASSGTVSHVKLVMKEEGLEWSVAEDENGSRTKTLTPE